MSDFLTSLAALSLGAAPTLMPRRRSLFEPNAGEEPPGFPEAGDTLSESFPARRSWRPGRPEAVAITAAAADAAWRDEPAHQGNQPAARDEAVAPARADDGDRRNEPMPGRGLPEEPVSPRVGEHPAGRTAPGHDGPEPSSPPRAAAGPHLPGSALARPLASGMPDAPPPPARSGTAIHRTDEQEPMAPQAPGIPAAPGKAPTATDVERRQQTAEPEAFRAASPFPSAPPPPERRVAPAGMMEAGRQPASNARVRGRGMGPVDPERPAAIAPDAAAPPSYPHPPAGSRDRVVPLHVAPAPAPFPEVPPFPREPAQTSGPPPIHVSIGRIEVRAMPAPAAATSAGTTARQEREAARSSAPTLHDYLAKLDGRPS